MPQKAIWFQMNLLLLLLIPTLISTAFASVIINKPRNTTNSTDSAMSDSTKEVPKIVQLFDNRSTGGLLYLRIQQNITDVGWLISQFIILEVPDKNILKHVFSNDETNSPWTDDKQLIMSLLPRDEPRKDDAFFTILSELWMIDRQSGNATDFKSYTAYQSYSFLSVSHQLEGDLYAKVSETLFYRFYLTTKISGTPEQMNVVAKFFMTPAAGIVNYEGIDYELHNPARNSDKKLICKLYSAEKGLPQYIARKLWRYVLVLPMLPIYLILPFALNRM